jgi:hypothetical protein
MTPDQTPWSPEEDAILSRGIKNHMLAKEIRSGLPGRSLRSMTKRARYLAGIGALGGKL